MLGGNKFWKYHQGLSLRKTVLSLGGIGSQSQVRDWRLRYLIMFFKKIFTNFKSYR